MRKQVTCHVCHHLTEQDEKFGRQDTCPRCRAYLHCCLNCRFYDETAYNECHEPSAERVIDKDKANFCDYFEPATRGAGDTNEADTAKRALEDLFKK